jgi:alanine racemase
MTATSDAAEPTGGAGRPPSRWAWAEIDLDAVAHNVGVLCRTVAPSGVWAVVKADGYGHGAVRVARQALRAGADGLCVALVDEGIELRRAGVDAPILLLSEQPVERAADLVRHGLTPSAYTVGAVDALARAADAAGVSVGVHLNVDTGMQRVGVVLGRTAEVARHVADRSGQRLAGAYTHLACADEPESPASTEQLARFAEVLAELEAAGLGPEVVHAANSAAAFVFPAARYTFVRSGIAIYGISPGPGVDHLVSALRPVMALKARVSFVKRVVAGSSISYGWRHRFDTDTNVATLPLGYADGVPRRLGTLPDRPGADVLIGGRRCPIVGVVTMDQLMVDVGDSEVRPGDEAVLIGAQGDDRIRVDEWASRLGTIGYEIVCGIGARIPRVEVGEGGAGVPSHRLNS